MPLNRGLRNSSPRAELYRCSKAHVVYTARKRRQSWWPHAWAHGAGLIVFQVAQVDVGVKGGDSRDPVLVGRTPAQRIDVPLALQHQERLHGAVQPGVYSTRLSGREQFTLPKLDYANAHISARHAAGKHTGGSL